MIPSSQSHTSTASSPPHALDSRFLEGGNNSSRSNTASGSKMSFWDRVFFVDQEHLKLAREDHSRMINFFIANGAVCLLAVVDTVLAFHLTSLDSYARVYLSM